MKSSMQICCTRHVPRPRPELSAAALVLAMLMSISCSSAATIGQTVGSHDVHRPVASMPTSSAWVATSAAATREATSTPTPAPTPTPMPATVLDLQRVKPNELGIVPILEYHMIADAEETQWSRTPDHFRQDLQKLYAAGYRPISLNDLLDRRIDIPAGTSPIVFTFDDSSPGQFRFIEKDGQVTVDPDCAVGILEAFQASHPDFAARATFNVLPEAEQPHKLFGQPQYEAQKLRYLVEHGFEIGNHTWWHQRLDTVDDKEVQRQLAFAVRSIQEAVPGYKVRSLSLPLGMWPENKALAFDGSYEGATYHHDAVLLVGSEPVPSPYRKDFNPHELQRVQVFADNLDRWLAYLAKSLDERYVSDGDPNSIAFPQHLEPQLSQASVGDREVRPY